MASSRNRKPPERDVTAVVAAVLASAAVGAGARLCVALSGGVDSVVLLHALATLRARFGYALTAAHVHHGLSPHAEHWRAFCSDLCAALAVDLHTFTVTVRADDPAGLEAAARRERHRALSRVGGDWLVFGHHQDDQAETVLFRLLRGTGVRGAGAMAAIEPGTPGRLRPLLALRRAELLAHARALGLAWAEDESNADHRFTRNRLRHEVLPVLEAVFPSAVPALARAAEHFREADALLTEIAERDAHWCGDDPLDLARVLALSDARIRNLLRWRIRGMGVDAPPRARLGEALRQLRASGGAPLQLPLGRLACCAYRGALWLEEVAGDAPASVRWRGERALAWGAGRVEFEPVQGAGLAAA
ncbi:MAG TPA: tRNA lysidine(34) synthetase TilS, partial [Rhodocyclaceae bacterium]|nr:tRNA lysidine(34) synthetase TilS [Rhodocyclaceae bacterium]